MACAEAAFLIGRPTAEFPAGAGTYADTLYSAQRLDGRSLGGYKFAHCTFANVSFKDVELSDGTFDHCAFVGCYFRNTRIRNCGFVGVRFLSCDFPKVKVQSSDFRYAHFQACVIPLAELEHNLPSEPNLREELCRSLALAADGIGLAQDARGYRLMAQSALEEHLLAAVSAKSSWYEEHFRGTRRLSAGWHLLTSKFSGLLWGHGEKPLILFRNLLLMGILLFPSLLWSVRGQMLVNGNPPSLGGVIWLSVMTIIPVGGLNSVSTSSDTVRGLLAAESLSGLVILALFATVLVRRVLGR